MLKIPYGHHYIDEDDIQAVVEVLRHGPLTQGPKIAEFENAIAGYAGARYAVAVSSGTAALHLACIAADVSAGDNVITSPNTFVASANCACFVGAAPQFADIHPETLNIDPLALAKKCSDLKKVKAVIPVHFAGLPCDMPAIKNIADRYQAIVIEDAAHALGAAYPNGGRVGNCAFSDMTIFSFHPVKIIAAGEGGMITTNNEHLYRRLLRLRSHGINKPNDRLLNTSNAYFQGQMNRWYYEMQELGYNYRITDIQSSLGLSQFAKLERFVARRRDLAMRYDVALRNHPNISLTQTSGRQCSAHHLYALRIDFDRLGMARHQFMTKLADDGVGSQVHYIPVHLHPYYQKIGFQSVSFPVTEKYYQQALSIPLYYALSDAEQNLVIEKIKELLQ